MPTRERKEQYFTKLETLTQEYSKAFIVHVDFVGSQQLQEMRMELRGQAEILMGKNTMIRKAIRGFMEDRPELEALLPVMRGNVGFVFTNGDLADIRDKINSSKVPAAAKAGIIAPCDVSIPKGPSGLDPAQTSFFQALNIATKINKGSIEIINDVHLIKEGTKVGSSEAALLGKLGQKPFAYGLVIKHVYEAGALFEPSVLDIKDEDLMMSWGQGVTNVAMMSLGANYPTHASVPHIINNAFKSILAICVEADYDIPQSEDVKKFLADPEAFMAAAASAAPSGGGGGGGAAAATAAAPAPEPEPEDESDEDMGFGLFD